MTGAGTPEPATHAYEAWSAIIGRCRHWIGPASEGGRHCDLPAEHPVHSAAAGTAGTTPTAAEQVRDLLTRPMPINLHPFRGTPGLIGCSCLDCGQLPSHEAHRSTNPDPTAAGGIDTAAIRADHVLDGYTRGCAACGHDLPCDAIRLCDALDEARAELRAETAAHDMTCGERDSWNLRADDMKAAIARVRAALAEYVAPTDGALRCEDSFNHGVDRAVAEVRAALDGETP